jgi:hypothetical protein
MAMTTATITTLLPASAVASASHRLLSTAEPEFFEGGFSDPVAITVDGIGDAAVIDDDDDTRFGRALFGTMWVQVEFNKDPGEGEEDWPPLVEALLRAATEALAPHLPT